MAIFVASTLQRSQMQIKQVGVEVNKHAGTAATVVHTMPVSLRPCAFTVPTCMSCSCWAESIPWLHMWYTEIGRGFDNRYAAHMRASPGAKSCQSCLLKMTCYLQTGNLCKGCACLPLTTASIPSLHTCFHTRLFGCRLRWLAL